MNRLALLVAALATLLLAVPALAAGPVIINAQPNTITKGRASCTVGVSVGTTAPVGSDLAAAVTHTTSPILSTYQTGWVVQDGGPTQIPTQIYVRVFPGVSTITVQVLVRGLPVASADAFYVTC